MPDPDISKMSPAAQGFVAEYGHLPQTRREQDLYGAYRFGFDAGQMHGHREKIARAIRALEEADRG